MTFTPPTGPIIRAVKPQARNGDTRLARQTASWLKTTGIILIVLGIVIVIMNPVVVYSGEDSRDHPWETDATGFYVQAGLGIVLITVGVFLYYLGRKKEKKGV